MNKNDTMKWEDIYKVWKWEMCKFPVLSALVKLAALNAAVVIGNYTSVEYKRI